MPITPKSLQSAKYTDKRLKLWDGDGLYLHVLKTGKIWRCDYQFKGQKRTDKLGTYPALTLTAARKARDKLKITASEGTDPRPADPSETDNEQAYTFRTATEEWEARDGIEWSDSHRKNVTHRLKNYIFPVVGDMPLASVKPKHVREILDSITAGGHYETARKVRQYISQICRCAIIADHIDTDPAQALVSYVKRKKQPISYAHTTNPKEIAAILKTVADYTGGDSTRFALQIAPHVMLRPGELRGARWSEIDLVNKRWTIPAERMKKSDNGNHVVPLSDQVTALFKELRTINGRSELCFPGLRDIKRPISDNTLAAALRRLDIPKEKQSMHGWRHCASTLLNEAGGFDPDLIEIQLHHCDQSMRGKYNKAIHMASRSHMLQSWSNYLEALKSNEKNARLSHTLTSSK